MYVDATMLLRMIIQVISLLARLVSAGSFSYLKPLIIGGETAWRWSFFFHFPPFLRQKHLLSAVKQLGGGKFSTAK